MTDTLLILTYISDFAVNNDQGISRDISEKNLSLQALVLSRSLETAVQYCVITVSSTLNIPCQDESMTAQNTTDFCTGVQIYCVNKNEHMIALRIKMHSFVSKTKQPDLIKCYLNFSMPGWRFYFRDLLERGLFSKVSVSFFREVETPKESP